MLMDAPVNFIGFNVLFIDMFFYTFLMRCSSLYKIDMYMEMIYLSTIWCMCVSRIYIYIRISVDI